MGGFCGLLEKNWPCLDGKFEVSSWSVFSVFDRKTFFKVTLKEFQFLIAENILMYLLVTLRIVILSKTSNTLEV